MTTLDYFVVNKTQRTKYRFNIDIFTKISFFELVSYKNSNFIYFLRAFVMSYLFDFYQKSLYIDSGTALHV